MTNERAIELLRRISDSQFDGPHGDERREALEMAVRALEGDGDLISRQAVMKEFSDFVRKSNNSDFAPTPTWNDAVSLVGSMPSAQPERKKGKWVDNKNIAFPQCSICGMWIDVLQQSGKMNFCPHCGADMRTEGNDDN